VSSSPGSSTGPAGVRLVISDAHAGLIQGARPLLPERRVRAAGWMRKLLSAVHHRHRQMTAALILTVFAQPDADTARTQLRAVVDQLTPGASTVAERLEAMEADVLAYTGFLAAHWYGCSIAGAVLVSDEDAGSRG
jgi:putative transposase